MKDPAHKRSSSYVNHSCTPTARSVQQTRALSYPRKALRPMQQIHGISLIRNLIGYGFLAPQNVLIVLCLVGALLSLVWQRIGIRLVLISSFSLFVSATPAFSSCLLW